MRLPFANRAKPAAAIVRVGEAGVNTMGTSRTAMSTQTDIIVLKITARIRVAG